MTPVVVSQYDCIESKSCDGESDLCSVQLVDVYRLVEDQIDIPSVAVEVVRGKVLVYPVFVIVQLLMLCMRRTEYKYLFGVDFPTVARDLLLSWSESVLSDR
jgi:hypothetical protein